ncbi:hypothetical protein CROQUDRAFT_663362 [Cronartium quercuum f. sp. fusiforme G11]|uniref:Methylated-DNA--protein-cysteine methyltransferase n=1 Tax=Cronartium quercuum f. sp. fusiforme G11 TaxID=708437 RepID=A0A9P6NDJ7_9BASI|nr:hypothetical protein CROQUDRAFT_663362 [Cronartium quercuum f. sp. fusiforme G11]
MSIAQDSRDIVPTPALLVSTPLPQLSEPVQITYPTTKLQREIYLTPHGKQLSDFQWRVYDVVLRIPYGRVTTYGILAELLSTPHQSGSKARRGSPQAVGNALRTNPFAPFIPCHRIVNADLYIGGFFGDYGIQTATSPGPGAIRNRKVKQRGTSNHVGRKIELLTSEGVRVGHDGMLEGICNDDLWRG